MVDIEIKFLYWIGHGLKNELLSRLSVGQGGIDGEMSIFINCTLSLLELKCQWIHDVHD